MIKRIDNRHKDFYKLFGPIFGSRYIENKTKDRIYDDDFKNWVFFIRNKKIIAFLSMKNNQIKNAWHEPECEKELELLLKDVYHEINGGIVSIIFSKSFEKTNYITEKVSPNFIKIQGGFKYEEN
ncbi:hypothetical protein [Streptobacillus moniliformis]|uniref:hypothetical protein n=1 Tax=Streptobacillus moniliformis TaxID=34105 RepID=UPI0007E49079|nr:hypothetical protein [Streptobacillus moniliformis]